MANGPRWIWQQIRGAQKRRATMNQKPAKYLHLRVDRGGQAVNSAVQRIGLILCGDPAVAVRTLTAEDESDKTPMGSAQIDQLLLYAVSEDYFAARHYLNGTIEEGGRRPFGQPRDQSFFAQDESREF